MTKKKKIAIGITIAVAAVILFNPISIFIAYAFLEDASSNIAYNIGREKAYNAASAYIEEKYDGKYNILNDLKDSYFYFDGLRLNGYASFDNVTVSITDGKIICSDNFQISEIENAVKKYYFTDNFLGTPLYLYVNLYDHRYNAYFDGDIEKFIAENPVSIDFKVLYSSNDNIEDYNSFIADKIQFFDIKFDNVTCGIYFKGDTVNVTNGSDYNSYFSDNDEDFEVYVNYPAGKDYAGLEAGGYRKYKWGDYENFILPLDLQEIDEYTAVSCDVDFNFKPTDDLTSREVLKYDNSARNPIPEESPVIINDNIYKIDFGGISERYAWLRLDMNHYGLTPDSVPLTVKISTYIDPAKHGELYYKSLGYVGKLQNEELSSRDVVDDCHYCYDDKYMYIMVNIYAFDYIAFAEK